MTKSESLQIQVDAIKEISVYIQTTFSPDKRTITTDEILKLLRKYAREVMKSSSN